MQIRKSALFTLRHQSVPVVSVAGMLAGNLTVSHEERVIASSVLTGRSTELTGLDYYILAHVPSPAWVPIGALIQQLRVGPECIQRLCELGLLLSDAPLMNCVALREREERILALDWDDYAALYHIYSRVEDVDAAEPVRQMTGAPALAGPAQAGPPQAGLPQTGPPRADAQINDFLALGAQLSEQLQQKSQAYDAAPGPFHHPPNAQPTVDLPLPHCDGELYQLLRRRQTYRVFDDNNPMSVEELSTVLYFTFGCLGYAELAPGLIGLRKTSPSGGSLHPIEAYPLIRNVQGVQPGLYHYDVERHGLSLMQPMSSAEVQHHAEKFALGQTFFGSAHVMFLLTARWYRNFWKYRKAQKSYRVIHVDAGHLSQTLYLVCTDLGLGAFYTGAINDINIETALGVDPLIEGVIGVAGCGRPLQGNPPPLVLQTHPYQPQR